MKMKDEAGGSLFMSHPDARAKVKRKKMKDEGNRTQDEANPHPSSFILHPLHLRGALRAG